MVEVEPITLPWALALNAGQHEFTGQFGIDVVPGWYGFDRVLPMLETYARSSDPPEWGPHLFFDGNVLVGNGGWKGEPVDGVAELGYAIAPSRQGNGLATAAVLELLSRGHTAGLRLAVAHTLGAESASTSVLRRCGFTMVAESTDPALGLIWRWEKQLSVRQP